jgi:4-methyl-5(b-hydroxyethyl)-thiazole monophosphate biosynthesis
MSYKTALIILHTGFEEIEAVTTIDVLDRADIIVTTASREESLAVVGRSKITLNAQLPLGEALLHDYDVLILPGGPGTPHMVEDARIIKAVQTQAQSGKLLAAICAAPLVLEKAGLLKGKHFTAHSCTWEQLPEADRKHPVITDGNLITANGPAAAIPFGLAIVEGLSGKAQADHVAEALGIIR